MSKTSTRQCNAAKKALVLRAWRIERLASATRRLDAFSGVKKLAKIAALAADERGNVNVRAVAAAKAKTVRAEIRTQKRTAPPSRPSFLPRTAAELQALKQKVSGERKAKREAKRGRQSDAHRQVSTAIAKLERGKA